MISDIDKATNGPIVSIDYTSQRGLELKWNTKGLLENNQQTTIKHLFLLGGDDIDLQFNFISLYYKKVKLGDIVGLLTPGRINQSQPFKFHWLQKSNIINDIRPYLKKKYASEATAVERIAYVLNNLPNNEQLMFLNVFSEQKKQIEEFIRGKRFEGLHHVILNIFTRDPTCDKQIDLHTGINYWFLNQMDQVENVCAKVKKYLTMIALSKLEIRIQSLNGHMFSQNTCNWHNIDFSTIEKVYFGVFSEECSEFIYFVTQESLAKFTLDIQINLVYRLPSGKKIKCQKSITLLNDNSKVYQRTYSSQEEQMKEFQLKKDFTIFSNFGKKQALIWVIDVKEKLDYL